ncbi:hypothetical protein [Streptomyces sp. UNOB3_S3]|nr:hypothetical protein [Streptomyces sp. UNOB3_S3]
MREVAVVARSSPVMTVVAGRGAGRRGSVARAGLGWWLATSAS